VRQQLFKYVGDIDVPTDTTTNDIITSDGFPIFLYVTIRRSKLVNLDKVFHNIIRCCLAIHIGL